MRYLLVLVAFATGCALDCEEIRADADWPSDLSTLHVDMVLSNLGLPTFPCETIDECVADVRASLAPPPPPVPDVVAEDVRYVLPAGSLVLAGATDIVVTLERRGDLVDMRLRFSLPRSVADGTLAEFYVVDRGAPGREKPQLVLGLGEGDRLEPRTGTRFLFGGERMVEYYVLPRRVRAVSVVSPLNPNVVPLLAAMPGLEEALVAEGLLEPKRVRIASVR